MHHGRKIGLFHPRVTSTVVTQGRKRAYFRKADAVLFMTHVVIFEFLNASGTRRMSQEYEK